MPSPGAATAQAPPVIPHGMLLPHPDAGPPPGNINMSSPAPSLSMPSMSNAHPQLVTGPNRGQAMMTSGEPVQMGTTLGDQTERSRLLSTGAGVDQIANRVEGTGFGQNHPFLGKLLGGVAQTAGKIGDVGLSLLAPEIAAQIPGTSIHHQMLLGQANQAVNQDVGNAQKEAQTANENATAGKTNAETPEVAPEAESKIGLENAQASEAPAVIAEHNAQAANLLHPQAKTDFEAWQAQNPGKPIEEWIKASQKPTAIAPEQQYLTEYAQKHPGSTVAEAERQYMLDTQRPPQAPAVNMFIPGAQPGTETLQTVRPGQTVASGAQTAAGVNAVNTPTMQQRTAAGRAQTVVDMAPEVLARIDTMAPKLGPIEGRWNEFMQGKIGADDPDFAALRSDLLMMSSAVALAHAQGRLPENLRLEFDNAINSPKQTPANLKATIQTMLPWLQKMQNQGKPNSQSQDGETIRAIDPQGVLHEAPAGTKLPAGWKAQ
jgi:hypothetical protein